jgi:hypothetical protein
VNKLTPWGLRQHRQAWRKWKMSLRTNFKAYTNTFKWNGKFLAAAPARPNNGRSVKTSSNHSKLLDISPLPWAE